MDRGRSAAVGQLMDCNKRAELAERKLLHEFTPTSSEFMECQYALTRMLCSHASCLLPAARCPLPAACCLLPAAAVACVFSSRIKALCAAQTQPNQPARAWARA